MSLLVEGSRPKVERLRPEVEALRPDLGRMYSTVTQRRVQIPQDSESTTVRLLYTGWSSTEVQTVDKEGKLVKLFGFGPKLGEEGAEVVAAETREQIITESSQVLYYTLVGCVYYNITPGALFEAVNNTLEVQAKAIVQPDKLRQNVGSAATNLVIAGVNADRKLVTQEDIDLVTLRAAELVVALYRLWELKGISPEEVGKKI